MRTFFGPPAMTLSGSLRYSMLMFHQFSLTRIAFGTLFLSVLAAPSVWAGQAKIVEVPSGPAFVTLPGETEIKARGGQNLTVDALLRTNKPGRMQVMLKNGRQFRMGGDASLRVGASTIQLFKGSVLGWVKPGQIRRVPFRIKTRVATASIQGTTVWMELTDDQFKVLSWEGTVQVETTNGQHFTLKGGEQLLLDLQRQLVIVKGQLDGLEAVLGQLGGGGGGGFFSDPFKPEAEESKGSEELDGKKRSWISPPRSLSREETERRLQQSLLINGFSTPLETLPDIERELGVVAPSQ